MYPRGANIETPPAFVLSSEAKPEESLRQEEMIENCYDDINRSNEIACSIFDSEYSFSCIRIHYSGSPCRKTI